MIRGIHSVGIWAAFCLALAPLVSVADTATSRPSGRLDRREVEPVAQALELRLDPAADGFSGRTRIDLVVHGATATFRLYARDLELGAAVLEPHLGGNSVPLAAKRGALGLLTLSSAAPVAPGAYALRIEFTGKYRRDGEGLYKTEFGGAPYLFTQLESRSGRLVFPCWDEPEFKLPWQVSLSVPDAARAFSNTEAVTETSADGWRSLQFARTPPMPAYLVAFAVGPLETVPVPGLAVPGRIITARGQTGLAGAIAGETPRILTALEDYFGIPYPYGKLDQVAVPEFTYGGMENAGLITYRDEYVLRPAGDVDPTNRRRLIQLVAHEIAHHWFGDLVTMEWWNDLWLNESFASWMEGKVLGLAYPELRYELHAVEAKQRAFQIDALASVRPMRCEITAEDDPEQFVDELSYEKGQAVLTMIEAWVGPDAFRTAMRRYFLEHRWGSTRSDDLWAAFQGSSDDDVPALAGSFVDQAGAPQVNLELLDGNRVRLRQKRYAALGGTGPAPADEPFWQVPVRVRYSIAGAVHTARVLLRAREQIEALPGISRADWILPNADESGYYRWQLGPDLERALFAAIGPALSPVEQLGVLTNAAALHAAGELAPDRYLPFLVDSTRAADPTVARHAIEALMGLRAAYLNDGDGALFAAFCRAVVGPVLARVGLQPRDAESGETAALRRVVIRSLGVRGGDPAVIAQARAWTAQLLRDPRSVDAGVAEAALRVATWHGDAALFDDCLAAFRSASVPTDRAMFLEALGGFRDRALCERALELSLGGGFRSHERLTPAGAMAGSSQAHREIVVQWMMHNFDAIRRSTSGFAISQLITLAEGPDPALFRRARDFLADPARADGASAKVIAEADDRDAQRLALRQRWAAASRTVLERYAVAKRE